MAEEDDVRAERRRRLEVGRLPSRASARAAKTPDLTTNDGSVEGEVECEK